VGLDLERAAPLELSCGSRGGPVHMTQLNRSRGTDIDCALIISFISAPRIICGMMAKTISFSRFSAVV